MLRLEGVIDAGADEKEKGCCGNPPSVVFTLASCCHCSRFPSQRNDSFPAAQPSPLCLPPVLVFCSTKSQMGEEELQKPFLFKTHLVKLAFPDCWTGDAACERTSNLYLICFIRRGLHHANPIKIRRAPAREGHVHVAVCLLALPYRARVSPHLSPEGSWDVVHSGCPVKCSAIQASYFTLQIL